MTSITRSGTAKKLPWTGHWWPMYVNTAYSLYQIDGPHDKFDKYIQTLTNQNPGCREWEEKYHSKTIFDTSGHCNGWTASAILEDEPYPSLSGTLYKNGVLFSVGDLKGLLAAVHWWDWCEVQDVSNAHDFHQILLQWLGNGKAVAMDTNPSAGIPVNHPAYKFEMTANVDNNDPKKWHVDCKVWFADYNSSNPSYIGLKPMLVQYKYWISSQNGDFDKPDKGGWKSISRPDFVWVPEYVDLNPAYTYMKYNILEPNPILQYYYSHIKNLTKPLGTSLIVFTDFQAIIPYPKRIPEWEQLDFVNSLIFEGLIKFNPFIDHVPPIPDSIVPGIATSWELSDDGLNCLFYLREDVTFHDGSPLTAEDVAFTYHTLMNPHNESMEYKKLTNIIANVEAEDDHSVRFELKKKMSNFPAIHGHYGILPGKLVEEVGIQEFLTHPVGTGPFAFESKQSNHYLTLVAFQHYYLGRPKLDKILFLEVPDIDRRLDLISEGVADIALFNYSLEIKRKGDNLPDISTYAFPKDRPCRLILQNARVQGLVSNEFNSAWNAVNWHINSELPGPGTLTPMGPLNRRITRNRINDNTNLRTSHKRLPEWREGVWWLIQLQQKTMRPSVNKKIWSLPLRLFFEVVGEDEIDKTLCFHVRVTYPDRPRDAPYQFADIWFTKKERLLLKGLMHVGDLTIPMDYYFLTKLLKTTPIEVNYEGKPRILLDPRWPKEKVKLQAYQLITPTNGSRITTDSAPFPLRIDESDYVVELLDWDSR